MRDRLKFIASALLAYPLFRLSGASPAWAGNLPRARELNKRGERLLETGQYTDAIIVFNNMREACADKAYCKGVAAYYLGRANLEMAEYDKAVQHFREAEAVFDKLKKDNERATVVQARARILAEQSQYKESMDLYGDAGSVFLKFRNTGALFEMFNSTGAIQAYKGLYNECLECLGVANRLLPPKADPRQLAVLNNNTGLAHMMKQEYGIAEQSFKKALEQFNKYGDRKGIATALNNLAFIYEARSEYPAALRAQTKSLEIAKEINDVRGQALALNNLGNIKLRTGNYKEARESYQTSLVITEGRGMKQFAAETLNNLGLVSVVRGEYARAIETFKRSHHMATEVGALTSQAWALHNMGFIFKDQGNLNDSRTCADNAVQIGVKTGNRKLEAAAAQRRGNLREYVGQFDDASTDYKLAARLQKVTQDSYFRSITMLDLANDLLRKGHSEPALKYYRDALRIRRSIGAPYGEFACRMVIFYVERGGYSQKGSAPDSAESRAERKEDLNRARKALEVATNLVPADQVAETLLLTYARARLLLEEEPDKAVAEFTKLGSAAKSAAIPRYEYLASVGLGLAYEKLQKTSLARTFFQAAADYVDSIWKSLDEKTRQTFPEGEQILGIKNKLAKEHLQRMGSA
ncbi:MAG: tetratricopeptide repeat protein [Thermodesulfobacteriota bacterium]